MAGQKQKKKTGQGRTRNWLCAVYPESLPDRWREQMDRVGVPWVESPLHDQDYFDEDFDYEDERAKGNPEKKKDHIHLMIMYDGVKTQQQVYDDFSFLNIDKYRFIKMASPKGHLFYIVHDPSRYPNKHPYSWNDVKYHCGANYDDIMTPTASEANQIYWDIINWANINRVSEICTIQRYAYRHQIRDWIYVLHRKSVMLNQYLYSWRQLGGAEEEIRYDENGVLNE